MRPRALLDQLPSQGDAAIPRYDLTFELIATPDCQPWSELHTYSKWKVFTETVGYTVVKWEAHGHCDRHTDISHGESTRAHGVQTNQAKAGLILQRFINPDSWLPGTRHLPLHCITRTKQNIVNWGHLVTPYYTLRTANGQESNRRITTNKPIQMLPVLTRTAPGRTDRGIRKPKRALLIVDSHRD